MCFKPVLDQMNTKDLPLKKHRTGVLSGIIPAGKAKQSESGNRLTRCIGIGNYRRAENYQYVKFLRTNAAEQYARTEQTSKAFK